MSMPEVSGYSAVGAPPFEVVEMLESGNVEVTRRIEIYEADGTTLWSGMGDTSRLVDGGVTVDYNSDERRKIDVSLENIDNALRPDPNGGLWYDKVIKAYRGCTYLAASANCPTAILSDTASQNDIRRLSQTLSGMGYSAVMDQVTNRDFTSLLDYSAIVAMTDTAAPYSYATSLLLPLFEAGRTIVTIGAGPIADLPHYTASQMVTETGVWPMPRDNPSLGAFIAQKVPGNASVTMPTFAHATAERISIWPGEQSPFGTTGALVRNANGGFWFDLHLNNIYIPQALKLLSHMLKYMRNFNPYKTWETQIGEFYIDGIRPQAFPATVAITGRDGTKKLMLSKLSRNSSFGVGTSLKDFVIGQLALGGVPVSRQRLDVGDETFSTEMSFDRGTSRWDMIKSALESFGYERFFNGEGNFVVRKYLDPSTSPSSWAFGTGPRGNLVTVEPSVNDSRIYNKVIVTSSPSGDEGNPMGYFGEAEVTDPTSPVHQNRIGERTLPIDADWLSSDAECLALANERLKITALESYELNLETIYYPWLECGEIITVRDPKALDHEPDRYLLDSLSLPFGLGAMSSTAKRVTFVGSSGGGVIGDDNV